MKKSCFSVLLVLFFCFGILSGCEKEPVPAEKAYIYKIEEFKPGGVFYDTIYDVFYDGKFLHILAQRFEVLPEDPSLPPDDLLHADDYTEYIKTDDSGEVIERKTLSVSLHEDADNGVYYNNIYIEDNITYLLRFTYSGFSYNSMDFSEVETKIDLVSYDGENYTELLNINEVFAPYFTDFFMLYVEEFIVHDGIFYIFADRKVYAVDIETGEIVFNNSSLPEGNRVGGIYPTKDGVSILSETTEIENGENIKKTAIYPIDTKTGLVGNAVYIPVGSSNETFVTGGKDFEYYGYKTSSIFGYNTDDETKTTIVDLSASGSNLLDLSRLIAFPDGRFLISGVDPSDWRVNVTRMFFLTKVNPKDVPDKTTVKIGSLFDNSTYYPRMLNGFLNKYPQYQPELIIYAPAGSSSADQAVTELNTAIISGNGPDVLFMNKSMPYESYAAKGVFADLYPWFDSDDEYSRGDIVEPLLKATEKDGKLYSLAPAFSFATLVGKTSIFGDTPGISVDKMTSIAANYEGASLFSPSMSRQDLLNEFVYRILGNFIDFENGRCNFTDPEFIKLLELAKTYPDASKIASTDWGYHGDTTEYSDEETLLYICRCWDYRFMISFESAQFEEPVTLLGLPNASGNSGIKLTSTFELAMLSDAANPDGGWAFIKYMLVHQDPINYSVGATSLLAFPSLKTSFDEFAEYSQKTQFEYDPRSGERVPRERMWGIHGVMGNPDCTDEQLEKLFDAIASNTGFARGDVHLEKIISEETALYFDDLKSVEETVQIIQNRATTYIEESM